MSLIETFKPDILLTDPWKKKAWDAVEKMGFPTKKWDAFRYVSLKSFYETSFGAIEKEGIAVSKMDGIIALSLTEAMRSYGPLLQKSFSKALEKEKNPFSLFNTALYQEGLFLYIPPGKKATIEWCFPEVKEGAVYLPRIEIFLGKGASLKASYRHIGKGTYFHNQHMQITLDEGAHLELDEHLEHSSEGFGMHTVRAHVKRDATFNLLTFSKGAKCERHDISAQLLGENSEVHLKGLSIGNDKDEIHHYIHMHHIAPHCRSHQHYKTALMGRSRSSFEGKIFVEKEAQKTEAYQLNNNLLLSPKAQAMSKPNLEIFADDVKASHGATCAQPKEEELFYLRTRGLSSSDAKWHLARGFCKEIINSPEIDRFLSVPE